MTNSAFLSQLTQTCPTQIALPDIPTNCYGMLQYKQFIPLVHGNEMIIGRSLECHLRLEDSMVSRKQCVIKQIQTHTCIRVFGRIMLNNLFLESGFYLLNDLDVIKIANEVLVFHSTSKVRVDQDSTLLKHHYSIGRQLGRGGYSNVHVGIIIETGKLCAIKTTDIRVIERDCGEKELGFAHLNHPNIATIHEAIRSEHSYYLIMDYYGGNDLHDFIHGTVLAEDQMKWIMFQLLQAVHYCHLNSIVHQDLKPENIVLDFEMNKKFPKCAISDFGLANTCHGRVYDKCGTYPYIPPETILDKGHTLLFDSWSLGMILIQL